MKTLALVVSLVSLNAFAADTNTYPRVEKYSYQCVQSNTQKEAGSQEWKTQEDKYSGTGEDIILDAQNLISTEVDESGRTVTKIKKEKIDADTIKKTTEMDYTSTDGQDTFKSVTVQVIKKIKGVDTIISSEVDGQARPVVWSKYYIELDAKTSVYTAVHNQPSLRNNKHIEYSRIFQSCIYTNQ